MSEMYCPQCGREVEPDGEARFCRYCGLELSDTKDNLRGYSEIKREGYKFINVSFVLAAILFWIEYFKLVPWGSFWGGNFLLIALFGYIFGLWFMGNWVVDRPARYVKNKKDDDPGNLSHGNTRALPESRSEPIPAQDLSVKKTAEMLERPSVTDNTTRELTRD